MKNNGIFILLLFDKQYIAVGLIPGESIFFNIDIRMYKYDVKMDISFLFSSPLIQYIFFIYPIII